MSNITKHYDILRNLDESFVQKIGILSICNHAKNYSAFIITTDDKAYGIGYNRNGCFGLEPNITLTKPKYLSQLSYKKIVSFEYGSRHIMALSSDGKVFSLFKKRKVFALQLKNHFVNQFITDICICDYHSLVLTKDGQVYSLNQNRCQLIDCKCYAYRGSPLIPVKLKGLKGKKVIAISCGKRHSLVLTNKGKVYSLGVNFKGELGLGRSKFSKLPSLISIGENIIIKKISCGYFHSLLLSNDGFIYSFGKNTHGQLGYDRDLNSTNENAKRGYIPMKLQLANIETIISKGGEKSIVRTAEMFYYIWGYWFGESIKNPMKIEPNTYLEEYVLQEIYVRNFIFNSVTKLDLVATDILSFKNEFDVKSELSHCMYGRILKAVRRSDKQIYAIKKINLDLISREKILDSIQNSRNLNSQFSIRYEKFWFDNKTQIGSHITDCFIQMELCYSTLKFAIKKLNSELDQKVSIELTYIGYFISSQLFIEILEIISYLHEKTPPIIHGSLTTNNFILTFSQYGRFLKLGDFYMDRPVTPLNTKPHIKSDIHDLGVILEELFNIDVNDESDIENSLKLLAKYKNLFKIHKHMTARRPLSRSDCKKVLARRKLWAIESTEIDDDTSVKVIMYKIIEMIVNDSLHSSILLKMIKEKKFQCDISDIELTKQNFEKPEKFNEIRTIANGSYGVVVEIESEDDGKRYALKKIPTDKSSLDEKLKEVNLIKDLDSEFIVQYLNHWTEPNFFIDSGIYDSSRFSLSPGHIAFDPRNNLLLNIKMELCCASLKQMFQNFKLDAKYRKIQLLTKSSYYVASELFIEIMQSVDYLHKQSPPIIHRDLKPDNILITHGNNGRFTKIGDFGLATTHEFDEQSHTENCGTKKYMPPGEITSRKYDMARDIFSLGVIAQQLLKFDVDKDYESQEIDSLQFKYSKVSKLTKGLLKHDICSRKVFNTMLKESKTWALCLDDIKKEDKFNQTVTMAEHAVEIEVDFIGYFIMKKFKFQTNI